MIKNNRDKKLNNKGVTLMELIVVVAIISVMTGAIVLGASFLFNSRVKKAYNLFQSSYSEARTNTMSKASASDLKLTYEDKRYYIEVGNQGREEILSSPYVIYYETCNADGNVVTAKKELTGTLTISFKRATGGMNPIKDNEYLSVLYINDKVLYFTPDSGKYSSEQTTIKGGN